MARLTAEQVAEQIESGITGRESDWADGHDCASRVAARLIRSNLIESPDERRERFEAWMQEQWPRSVDPWQVWNAALDFGGGGGE